MGDFADDMERRADEERHGEPLDSDGLRDDALDALANVAALEMLGTARKYTIEVSYPGLEARTLFGLYDDAVDAMRTAQEVQDGLRQEHPGAEWVARPVAIHGRLPG